MSEAAQIVVVLKRSLKARGMTYADLGRALKLSEASIKRIFAQETFSLDRLEEMRRPRDEHCRGRTDVRAADFPGTICALKKLRLLSNPARGAV
jgi:hypothetical protein